MLDQLLEVLTPRHEGEDRFTGGNMHPEGFRVYGGQVLAQAVSAAIATVDDDRVLHSQHAYFLRPGDVTLPIQLEVERARDGTSFSSRRVVALQRGKPIFVSGLSFQQASKGDDYQPQMPSGLPQPEDLPSERQLSLEAGSLDESFMITTGEDLDIRVVEPVDWNWFGGLARSSVATSTISFWSRETGRISGNLCCTRWRRDRSMPISTR